LRHGPMSIKCFFVLNCLLGSSLKIQKRDI
jgi:hypothetical protein